jgi:sulfite reductase alpha subunit-like flavoprotein
MSLPESPEITILYSSSSPLRNAEHAAYELETLLINNKYTVSTLSLSSFPPEDLPNINYCIFIVSTAGYGTFPLQSANFFDFIFQSNLPSILTDLNFTVFGLGDSSYEKFNYCAKALRKRLLQLGGNEIFKIGLGDEQHDFCYEGEFIPWREALIYELNTNHFAFHSFKELPYQYKYKLTYVNKIQKDNIETNKGVIKEIKKLTKDDSIRKVVQITISNISKQISYKPFDIIEVFPTNTNYNDIEYLFKYFNIENDINKTILLVDNKTSNHITTCTVKDLFIKYLNLNGIVKRSFCKVCSQYTDDSLHKTKLLLYSSNEGRGEFYSYAIEEKRTYIEFLKDFSSVKLPLEIFISEVGLIQPRQFSISSNYIENDSHLEITLGIIDYKTPFQRRKIGLFSEMILNIMNNKCLSRDICFNVINGRINLNSNKNYMFIATGTGIAPIRNALRYLNNVYAKGEYLLLYGTRNKEKDYLYGDEFDNKHIFYNNINLKILNAFSRDTNSKYYVQNLILDNVDMIYEFIMNNNCEYISVVGNAKFLPLGITLAMCDILKTKQKLNNEEQAKELFKLKIQPKLVIESW